VLAGVGRLPLGRRGRLAHLRNGTVVAGLEPAFEGTRAFLSGTCEPGRSGELLRETMDVLIECAGGLTAAEVDSAAEFCAGQWVLALDEDGTTADLVAQQIAFGRGLAEIEVFPARLRDVTAKDVSTAVDCLFAPGRMRGGVVDARAPEGLPSAWAVDGEPVHPRRDRP
jgi:predicted Zn-dependent peptidase